MGTAVDDILFRPLRLRGFSAENRLWRSSISGRFDLYDGTGTEARIRWEEKFARGGVGLIITSFVPVHPHGRILPNYATIADDRSVPFWRQLVGRVHALGARILIQLSHAGRQRDVRSLEFPTGLSSTSRPDALHGFPTARMTEAQIQDTVRAFAEGARRAREAGADGVELHGGNGYLIHQFLSGAINDRQDGYGGELAHRYRFASEIVAAIRRTVGRDFHLQFKLGAVDHGDALFPWQPRGNTLDDGVAVARWLERDGVDCIHVSVGNMFPHPRNPAGAFPVEVAARTYDTVASEGSHALRNLLIFRTPPFNAAFKWWWERSSGLPPGGDPEGLNLPLSRAIKQAVRIPVAVTGGFQTASVIRAALERGDCDAVTMARPLIANNDLPRLFAAGHDRAPRPCTFCNRCLIEVLENPLGCYDPSRFPSREAMVREIMSVFPGGGVDEPEVEREEETGAATAPAGGPEEPA